MLKYYCDKVIPPYCIEQLILIVSLCFLWGGKWHFKYFCMNYISLGALTMLHVVRKCKAVHCPSLYLLCNSPLPEGLRPSRAELEHHCGPRTPDSAAQYSPFLSHWGLKALNLCVCGGGIWASARSTTVANVICSKNIRPSGPLWTFPHSFPPYASLLCLFSWIKRPSR